MKYTYHLIHKFPKSASWIARVFANVSFFLSITKITDREALLSDSEYEETLSILRPGDIILVGAFRRMGTFIFDGSVTQL